MSIVGGLVHKHPEKDLSEDYRPAGWFARNAWMFVLGGSIAAWAVMAGLIYFG